MLDEQLTLGVAPNDLTYVKRFADNNNSKYSVQGRLPSVARELVVSHQVNGTGGVRSVISIDDTNVVPGLNGDKPAKTRLYVVLDHKSMLSVADIQKMFQRLGTLVNDPDFVTQLLNQEV